MLMALEPADIQQVDTDEGKVSHIAQLYLFTHFPTRHLLRVSPGLSCGKWCVSTASLAARMLPLSLSAVNVGAPDVV